MSKRARKGTQRQTVAAVQLFGRDDQRERYEARVVALVMQGHTVRKAETIAAQEIGDGEDPGMTATERAAARQRRRTLGEPCNIGKRDREPTDHDLAGGA